MTEIEKRIAAMNSIKNDESISDINHGVLFTTADVRHLLGITIDEALFLVKTGVIKSYEVELEQKREGKSFDEKMELFSAVSDYKSRETMSVRDLSKLLGLGKTSTYRLLSKNKFKTYIIFGKIYIDVSSFEDWYAGQFHYRKTNGERPGQKYGDTFGSAAIGKVLGISKSAGMNLLDRKNIDYIEVNGYRRIIRSSFMKWYNSQDHYKMKMSIDKAEGYEHK